MIFAAYRDDAYNVVLLLHIALMFVAFAPAFVHPFLGNQLKDDPSALTAFMARAAKNGHRIYLPAMAVGGLFGIGLIFMSDELIEFSDAWISGSFLVWILIMGILAGMILPGEKAMAEGDMSKEKQVAIGGQIATLLWLVMLYLMLFKPGADGIL